MNATPSGCGENLWEDLFDHFKPWQLFNAKNNGDPLLSNTDKMTFLTPRTLAPLLIFHHLVFLTFLKPSTITCA